MAPPPYRLEFYEDENGVQPVRRWILEDLSREQRQTLGVAMFEFLQHRGVGVCDIGWGKQLGTGLFEFRVRFESETTRSLYRIFCHAFGDRVVLLLAAYDKGEDPSKRRQQAEIATARRRLKDFNRRTLAVD